MSSEIQVFSGGYFNPLEPSADDMKLIDIAHHLSLICRYTGAVSRHYSVAEHSIIMASAIYNMTKEPVLALTALLHDGSEAYLTDLPRPVKYSKEFDFYRELEARVQGMIYRKFGNIMEQPAIIDDYDLAMLAVEKRVLLKTTSRDDEVWGPVFNSAKVKLEDGWIPTEHQCPHCVEGRFLVIYNDLVELIAMRRRAAC